MVEKKTKAMIFDSHDGKDNTAVSMLKSYVTQPCLTASAAVINITKQATTNVKPYRTPRSMVAKMIEKSMNSTSPCTLTGKDASQAI